MGEKVIVLLPLEAPHRAKLEAAAPGWEFLYREPSAVTDSEIGEATAIVGNLPPARLAKAAKLGLLQLNSAGTDGYTAPGVLPPGAALANATGAYGLGISEYMMGVLLSLSKKLPGYYDCQRAGEWRDLGPVRAICDSHVLAVGLGDIGGRFARLCKAFGAHVTGVRRAGTDKPEYIDRLVLIDELDSVLLEADTVALSLPGTKATYHLFDRERISKMKPGALLINVGRGTAIDPDALCDALESGQLGGAAIDVTEPEPLPAGHRLWKAPNLLITPHVSGGYHMPQTLGMIADIAAHNLAALRDGQPLRSLVDLETGYRRL